MECFGYRDGFFLGGGFMGIIGMLIVVVLIGIIIYAICSIFRRIN
ncbi:MAG: hypothetical protein ACRDDY_19720 [Clostridium sp.]